MTYRERRLRKAERLRKWADKRQGKANTVYKERERYAGDTAFWTQPGEIPERTRLFRRMDRAHADSTMASDMDSRADGIEAATDNAIYSDDDDATERLEERIAGLETERARIKEVNTSIRKGQPVELTPKEQRDLENLATHQAYYAPWKKGYPPYKLTNLSGNIRRQKLRLEELRNPTPRAPRVLTLRYGGECETCSRKLARGDIATYDKSDRTIRCYPPCEEVTSDA